ncbi:IGHG2 protein, partial [Polypterus senegalus]|nr:IGHG2 protein [Polypterus senegalus]
MRKPRIKQPYCLSLYQYDWSLVVHTSPTPQHCTAGSAIALSCTFPVPFGTPLHGIALKWTVSTVDNDHRTLYTFDGTSEWQFYNHSTVDRLRLIQGDATLHLKNVTLSDAGHYTCTVFIPPEMGASTFRLAVSVLPSVTLSPEFPFVTIGEEKMLLKQVKVQWLRCHGHKHVSTSAKVESTLLQEHFEDLSSSTENKPFKNSLMSCLSIVPSIEDDDREYQCKVCCLNIHPIIKKTCLKILVRPSHFQIESVPRIPMPEQNLVLSCRAERFYPKVISLKWFKDELPVKGVTQFGPFLDGGKLYSVWSQTEFLVSSNDQGAIYTCRVHHGSLTAICCKQKQAFLCSLDFECMKLKSQVAAVLKNHSLLLNDKVKILTYWYLFIAP